MQEFLKIAVVLIMSIPFIYMFYDVLRELITNLINVITKKAKPAVIQTVSSLFN